MKASILSSPAHTTVLEIKPNNSGGWLSVLTKSNLDKELTSFVDSYELSDGQAANLRARLIHKGWTELYRGEALK